jgi:hypothetical protein
VKYPHEPPAHGKAHSIPSGTTDTGRKCHSWVGDWRTDDRVTWRNEDGVWLAQIQRSANGKHTFLALWCEGSYVGYQDDSGWHSATARSRVHEHRVAARSFSLPLPLAG